MLKPDEILPPALAAVVGSAFCLIFLWFWRSEREMCAKGITTQAVVVKKFRGSGTNWLLTYAVFSFVDENQRRQQVEVKVLSRLWHGLREGGSTKITYLPGRPETAAPGPQWGRGLYSWIFLFFVLVGGGLAAAGLVNVIQILAAASHG